MADATPQAGAAGPPRRAGATAPSAGAAGPGPANFAAGYEPNRDPRLEAPVLILRQLGHAEFAGRHVVGRYAIVKNEIRAAEQTK